MPHEWQTCTTHAQPATASTSSSGGRVDALVHKILLAIFQTDGSCTSELEAMITSAKVAPHATTIPGRKSRSVFAPDILGPGAARSSHDSALRCARPRELTPGAEARYDPAVLEDRGRSLNGSLPNRPRGVWTSTVDSLGDRNVVRAAPC
eukprot:scaffold8923_cov67-Phaeocystis_antarctica.AAC.5